MQWHPGIVRPLITALPVTALALPIPGPAAAAKRKEGMGVGQCFIDGTVHPAGPGEAISSCCLEDGCWISNATWSDCHWDPKLTTTGAGSVVGAKGGVKEAVPGALKKYNAVPGSGPRKQ